MADIKTPFVAGFFDDPDAFMQAAQASTARGHVDHDGVMPYPVHGFDHKLGLRRSWIGKVVLAALLGGAFLGFMLQLYTMKLDWPLILAGKPYNSWPAFVVVTFESGILAGALTNMVCCLLIACRILPRPDTPTLRLDCSDDVFALCIPVAGNGTETEIRDFLAEQGAQDIAVYVTEGQRPSGPVNPEGETAHA